MIINLPFLRPVTAEAVVIRGPTGSGPKTVHVFVDRSEGDDQAGFNVLKNLTPNERINLDETDLNGTRAQVPLKDIDSYRSIRCLTLLVTGNQSQSGMTRISHVTVIGKPK
jgi:hypothetical protein